MLAYLGPRLINQLENLSTEALWYLLVTYDSANGAFNNILEELGMDFPERLKFDCQIAFPDLGIPDLVGSDSHGNILALVEVKFGAPLTHNQPEGYLHQLPSDILGLVLFLFPENRSGDYWDAITTKIKKSGYTISSPRGNAHLGLSVKVGPLTRIGYLTWEHLLNKAEEMMEQNSDERGLAELWQLTGLVHRLISKEPADHGLPVSGIETLGDKLRQVVDELASKLIETGDFDTKGYRATPGPGFYRRYGSVAGLINWFIEYNEDRGRRFGQSLLWLGCPYSEEILGRVRPLFDEEQIKPVFDGDNILFPLTPPSSTGAPSITEPLAEIRQVIDLLSD